MAKHPGINMNETRMLIEDSKLENILPAQQCHKISDSKKILVEISQIQGGPSTENKCFG